MNKEELKDILTKKKVINRNIISDYHEGQNAAYEYALDLIDQLDEPETTREKAYSKIAEEFPYSVPEIKMILSRCNQSGTSIANLLERISNHAEPDKPVVPKFVAEWYERNQFSGWWNWLYKWGKEPIEDELEKRVHDWFVDYHEYEFVDMHRIGYTAEEKKYCVLNTQQRTMLRKDHKGIVKTSGGVSLDTAKAYDNYQLTEKEIKDYDERYMAFAEEVQP